MTSSPDHDNLLDALIYLLPLSQPEDPRGTEKARILEPRIAILSAIQLFVSERRGNSRREPERRSRCAQRDVERVIASWWYGDRERNAPLALSKFIRDLIRNGYVEQGVAVGHGRFRTLALTRAGEELLASVRKERRQQVRRMLAKMSPEKRAVIEDCLPELWNAAWAIWKERVGDDAEAINIDVGDNLQRPR